MCGCFIGAAIGMVIMAMVVAGKKANERDVPK